MANPTRTVGRTHEPMLSLILQTIESSLEGSARRGMWRDPLVGLASAHDPRFARLRELVGPAHALPGDLLPDAETVVSYFLPFDERIVLANSSDRLDVAREWAEAYVETNAQLVRTNAKIVRVLEGHGVVAVAEPPTGRFDRIALKSTWSHKSVAVIAGLGSFGVHRMVITDSGCAGRFGSLIMNAAVDVEPRGERERCYHYASGGCLDCVKLCPLGALSETGVFDRQVCWARCKDVASAFPSLCSAGVCGKCAMGRCALTGASD